MDGHRPGRRKTLARVVLERADATLSGLVAYVQQRALLHADATERQVLQKAAKPRTGLAPNRSEPCWRASFSAKDSAMTWTTPKCYVMKCAARAAYGARYVRASIPNRFSIAGFASGPCRARAPLRSRSRLGARGRRRAVRAGHRRTVLVVRCPSVPTEPARAP